MIAWTKAAISGRHLTKPRLSLASLERKAVMAQESKETEIHKRKWEREREKKKTFVTSDGFRFHSDVILIKMYLREMQKSKKYPDFQFPSTEKSQHCQAWFDFSICVLTGLHPPFDCSHYCLAKPT